MTHGKVIVLGLVLAVSVVVLSTPAVLAQSLDEQWFKVNFSCTTKAVNPATGEFSDFNFSFNVFVRFVYAGPGSAPRGSIYTIEFWSQVAPGVWQITYIDSSQNSSPYSENFFPDTEYNAKNKAGIEIVGYMTPHVSLEPGGFRAGGEILGGTDSRGRHLYGWVLVKGTRVSSVPFPLS